MNAGASLGYSCMVYQNSDVASTSFDVGGSRLARLLGQATEGQSGLPRRSGSKGQSGLLPLLRSRNPCRAISVLRDWR